MNPSASMAPPFESHHRRSISAGGQPACYPASPPMDHHQQGPQPHGLGLQYTMGPPPSNVSPALSSPPNDWHHAHHTVTAYSAGGPPDIFSAAFDPFSGFPGSSNAGMAGGVHSPEAPGLDFCQTPTTASMASHRGSVSSYAHSDSSSSGAYTPRAKPEDSGEWYAATTHGMPYAAATAPSMGSPTEHLYREPSNETLYRPQAEAYMGPEAMNGPVKNGSFDSVHPTLPNAARVRKRRQRTTPEEATHECRVCGKLFKRSYNWKSHMETHNPERKYPHPCPHLVGSSPCSKKFQRKTDLDRHVDSVSQKSPLLSTQTNNI